MPSLSDKLKSLGVQVGARNLPAPAKANLHAIEKVLNGRTLENHQGKTFLVEEHYPWGTPHGASSIKIDQPLDILGRWAGSDLIASLHLNPLLLSIPRPPVCLAAVALTPS